MPDEGNANKSGAPNLATLQYLHGHVYHRIMWYRDEIWRITNPTWAGLGGFMVAVVTIANSLRNDGGDTKSIGYALIIGTTVIVFALNVLYVCYIRKLHKSVDELNDQMTTIQSELAEANGLVGSPGVHDVENKEYGKDCAYAAAKQLDGRPLLPRHNRYKQHCVFPSLALLFPAVNLILVLAVCGIVYIMLCAYPSSQRTHERVSERPAAPPATGP